MISSFTARYSSKQGKTAPGFHLGKWAASPLIGLTLILSGCAGNVHNMSVGGIPDDYRTNHPIYISEQDQIIDLPVGLYGNRITAGLRHTIQGVAQRYKSSSAEQIVILRPEGASNSGVAKRYVRQVRAELVKSGISKSRIGMSTYDASDYGDEAPIRIAYTAISASTDECGQWPEDLLIGSTAINPIGTVENKNYHNFGCATQNNLAAQIANPADLIAPRAKSPIDAARRSTAIGTYQSSGAGLGISQ